MLALLSVAFLLFIVVSTKTQTPPPSSDTLATESSVESSVESASLLKDKLGGTIRQGEEKRRKVSNRELMASIRAESWPTTPQSPLCETLGYFDSLPSLSSSSGDDEDDADESDDDVNNNVNNDHHHSHKSSLYGQWKIDYLTALSDTILSQHHSSSSLQTYHDGLHMALNAATSTTNTDTNTNTKTLSSLLPQVSTFDLNLLKFSLATRAHAPLCETYRVLGNAVAPSGKLIRTDDDNIISPPPQAFVIVEGRTDLVATTVQQLEHIIHNQDDHQEHHMEAWAQLLPDETPINIIHHTHQHQNQNQNQNQLNDNHSNTKTLILYGEMGSLQFATLLRHVLHMRLPFVVRHLGPISVQQPQQTILQGYGVRLDIRNVEYKSFDDKAAIHSDQSALEHHHKETHDDTTDTLINPAILHAKPNDKNNKILPLTNQVSTTITIPPQEQQKDLSLQATSVIAASDDPLYTLQQLAQNLPSHASALANMDVPNNLRTNAERLFDSYHSSQSSRMVNTDGTAEFYVNGRRISIDRPSFNLFQLIQTLREEDALLSSLQEQVGKYLHSISPTTPSPRTIAAIASLLTMGRQAFDSLSSSHDVEDTTSPSGGSAAAPEKVRIDVGRGYRGALLYVNDIERDAEYRQWPTRVQEMLYGMQYGQPPTIRRNMLTVVMAVDPLQDLDKGSAGGTSEAYIESMGMVLQMMQSGLPVRVGVLFASDHDIDTCLIELASGDDTSTDAKTTSKPCTSFPVVPDDERATTHASFKLFQHLHKNQGAMMALHYLYRTTERLAELRTTLPAPRNHFTLSELIDVHTSVSTELRLPQPQPSEVRKIIHAPDGSGTDVATYAGAVRFAAERRVRSPTAFVNGVYLPMASSAEECQMVVQEEMNHIVTMVMEGKITDSEPRSVYAMLLRGDNVYGAMHPLLTEMDDDGGTGAGYRLVEYDSHPDSIVEVTDNTGYAGGATLLYEAVVDLTTEKGVRSALSFMAAISRFKKKISDGDTKFKELAVAYQVVPSNGGSSRSVLGAVMRHARRFDEGVVKSILETAVGLGGETVDTVEQLFDGLADERVRDVLRNVVETDGCLTNDAEDDSNSRCPFVPLDLSDGEDTLLLANGRIYAPKDSIQLDDIEILATLERNAAKTVARKILGDDGKDAGNEGSSRATGANAYLTVARVAAYLGERFASPAFKGTTRADVVTPVESIARDFGTTAAGENWFYYSWNNDSNDVEYRSEVKITAILDPLSEATQRISPILRTIRDHLKLPLTVIIMPRLEITDDSTLPITSYYRFVAESESEGTAVFEGLPTNQVLTIRMDVPEPWDVQQSYAVQDTDALQCDSQSCGDEAYATALRKNSGGDDHGDQDDGGASSTVQDVRDLTQVEYQLNNLLFFGRCLDLTAGTPPNGLQLTLSDRIASTSDTVPNASMASNVEILTDGSLSDTIDGQDRSSALTERSTSDTLVMKTVGYWQLRANPGVWQLQIAKSSRGSEIFDMMTKGATSTDNLVITSKTLVMKDFVDRGKSLLVRRKPGFENADLFTTEDTDTQDEEDMVHVFSLATGHLYERFLKIMMISVTKRTSVKVKFWLFENYLSPSFKASAFAMAKKIGCELEFVTYKWPQWLRGQKEKQRIIWGYKILFLDVLFPLNLKKVIYVDADQVVRGDLKELWDLDLQGAPYGYTPFCESREETLGYQFWREGFWKNLLRGKPYHISALYVVDLERFRRELVGDKLRSLYQQLSADPNNLANLDQDLPNYAQTMVKIHSLPQDWLWCETWCSDETKTTAKTIDLCNNPEHKEPKVSMAKRIISGDLFDESWIELDAKVDFYEKEYINSAI